MKKIAIVLLSIFLLAGYVYAESKTDSIITSIAYPVKPDTAKKHIKMRADQLDYMKELQSLMANAVDMQEEQNAKDYSYLNLNLTSVHKELSFAQSLFLVEASHWNDRPNIKSLKAIISEISTSIEVMELVLNILIEDTPEITDELVLKHIEKVKVLVNQSVEILRVASADISDLINTNK